MKALVYHGAKDVRIDDRPKPKIKDNEDIILRVTSTALCGSDLHLYHGTVQGMEPGQTLGHEFMGVVEETGSDVREIKKDDRVVVPFNISCGTANVGFVDISYGPSVTGLTRTQSLEQHMVTHN